jgi:hypothetical protein
MVVGPGVERIILIAKVIYLKYSHQAQRYFFDRLCSLIKLPIMKLYRTHAIAHEYPRNPEKRLPKLSPRSDL